MTVIHFDRRAALLQNPRCPTRGEAADVVLLMRPGSPGYKAAKAMILSRGYLPVAEQYEEMEREERL